MFRITHLLATCGVVLGACATSSDHDLPITREAWIERLLSAEDARDAGDPIFARALERDDPVVRRASYRALGRIGQRVATRTVVGALENESDVELRAEAWFALGRIGPSTLPDLADRLAPTDEVERAAMVRALGIAGYDQALRRLLDALGDPSPLVRGASALAIVRAFGGREDPLGGRPVGTYRELGELIVGDPSSEVRWRACYACGKLGRDEFVPPLVAALQDEDALVRVFAAEALAAMTPNDATRDALVDRLSDSDWRVVVEAVKGLGRGEAGGVALRLVSLLAHGESSGHPSFHVRAAACGALGRLGALASPGALEGAGDVADALERSLADEYESVRGAALEALVRVAEPRRAAARLADVLEGRSVAPATRYLRAHVARAAAALPEADGFLVVTHLLGDDDGLVETAALEALAAFPARAEAARDALEEALSEDDVALRATAAASAATLGLVDLVPALEDALADSSGAEFVEARIAMLDALATLAGERAIPIVRDRLADEEPFVQMKAREALARIGGSIPELPRRRPPGRTFIPRAGRNVLIGRPLPRVELVTDRGAIMLELLIEDAPHHAGLFLERCRDGFYDGLTIHRLVPGFVVQGLDPRGDGFGTGGASLRSEVHPMRYERGTVGMPDAGLDTGGCQLFVTFRPQPRLDSRYTIFARVVDGMDVVERLDVGDRIEYVLAPKESGGQAGDDSRSSP